ncbi:hypothetical protein HPB52_022945 [Rhipicephalus sanguineus]|uniref:Endonuclease/exonuclease/phosphatase domain-containing protein n=1 Tax=Rhipicephalus sanguineus TaxID=34632 RepID=A0A9D4PQ19_RHISA|nr:hypothetical protein HPB52_022945 [Rhipicephalus sanguineus]
MVGRLLAAIARFSRPGEVTARAPPFEAAPERSPASDAATQRPETAPAAPAKTLPRMPADTIHIVGRPKTPVDLIKLPPWQLYEALLKAASLPDQPPASCDKLRVHPTNNTFTISVPDSVRAQAYLRITSLQIRDRTIKFHVHAPLPDDAFCGIMFNAYDSFTDDEILKDMQQRNPSMPVVGGRRMGRTNHVLVTMLGKCLPRSIFYHGVYFRLHPFYPRVEACFDCCKVGRQSLPPSKTQPLLSLWPGPPADTQQAHPIQHHAEASTQPGATTAAAVDPPQHSLTVTGAVAPASRPATAAGTDQPLQIPHPSLVPIEPLQLVLVAAALLAEFIPRIVTVLVHARSQEARLGPRTPRVAESVANVVTRYTEAKLDRTLVQPPATAPQPMEATAVPAAIAARDIDGSHDPNTKFEARFNTLQQAIAETNSSLKALKSYTEANNTSLNTLKNYTEATTAEINARLERRQHGPQTHNGLIMARPTLTVWQCNCRGYRRKRSHLQQLVQKRQADPQATEPAPDVIALQETSTTTSLPGYAAYHQLGSHASPCTSTLVHNSLTAVQHEKPQTFSARSSPREKAADFSHLFSATIALVGHAQLLLLGDFNARNSDWGYQPPTRIGNNVCRDISPDLTLCKNVTRATWDNTGILAGSEHNMLEITIETRLSNGRYSASCVKSPDTITDINVWITSLQRHVQATTREVETIADLPRTDSRLLHMWDAHAGLLRRQMSFKITWHLLRYLLDPCSPKLSAKKQLQRLLHRYPGTDAELLDELALRYVSLASPDAPPEKLPPCSGKANP